MKTDVHGFGIVLLQILTGLPALDENRPVKQNLKNWAFPFVICEHKLRDVIDRRLVNDYSFEGALQFAGLILRYLYPDRPSMEEVLEILGQINAIEKKPNDNSNSSSFTQPTTVHYHECKPKYSCHNRYMFSPDFEPKGSISQLAIDWWGL